MTREFLPKAQAKYRAWRFWERYWTWANLLIGGASVFLGALVAANTKSQFLDSLWSIVIAVMAPLLTFVLTVLKPSAQAQSFVSAGRVLEKALAVYEGDQDKDDKFLTDAISNGLDILNKVGSA
jgi:hypothetical protein